MKRSSRKKEASTSSHAKADGHPAEAAHSRHVVLTGATGFVGKVVLAELLREHKAHGLASITVLVRRQKGRTAHMRVAEQVLASAAFAGLRALGQRLVRVVEADLAASDLSLSPPDKASLLANTSHIIHCAASVDFDRPLAEAAASNITASLHLLALAKAMPSLKQLVVTSTAYVTPWRAGPLPAALVPLPRDAAHIWQDVQQGKGQRQLLAELGHPNTYTYTKCLAEHLVAAARAHVPTTIVRPSIISASWQRPFPGWIDSRAAFAGFVVTIGMGLLRVIDAEPTTKLDLVPVDVVADRLISAAFAAPAAAVAGDRTAPAPLTIRYAVSGPAHGAHIGETSQAIVRFFQRRPVGRRAQLHYVGPRSWRYRLTEQVRQSLPLKLARATLSARGDARGLRKVARTAATLTTINEVFPYFTHRTFAFACDEPLPADFSVGQYVERVCRGAYTHLLHRDGRQVPFAGGQVGTGSTAGDGAGGSAAGKLAALVDRRLARALFAKVTLDEPSFLRAQSGLHAQDRLAIVPVGDGPTASLLCRLLLQQRPDLGFSPSDVAAPSPAAAEGCGQGADHEVALPMASWLMHLASGGEFDGILPVTVAMTNPGPAKSPRRNVAKLYRQALHHLAGTLGQGTCAHLQAGTPLLFAEADTGEGLRAQLREALSGHVIVGRADLQAFLWLQPQVGLDLDQLCQAVAARGGQVMAAGQHDAAAVVDLVQERRARRRWQSLFYSDLLARFAQCWPVRFVATGKVAPVPTAAAGRPERRTTRLLYALAAPIVSDFAAIVRGIGRLLVVGERATARALLAEARVHDEQVALTALVAACEAGLLAREEKHGLGQATVVFRRVGDDAVVAALLQGCHLNGPQERPSKSPRPPKLPLSQLASATLH